jgi:aminoglycoside 3-N-acetyltransferase I
MIKRLTPPDLDLFIQLTRMFETAFDAGSPRNASPEYLGTLLEDPHFMAFAAIGDGQVWGGATAYLLPMYHSETAELFVYDLAVREDHRREGLGTALIMALREFCRLQDIHEIFVTAHDADGHALKFYSSTGGVAEKATLFAWPLDNMD